MSGETIGLSVIAQQESMMMDHVASFVPAEGLEVRMQEPAQLAFLSSPAHLLKRDLENGAEYLAVFAHPPLQGENLLRFLKKVAPDPDAKQDTALGVFFDWVLPERPEYYRDGGGERLLRLHQALGRHWTDFEQSRPDFISALMSGREPGPFMYRQRQQQVTLFTEQDLQKRFSGRALDFSVLKATFEGDDSPDPTERIANYMLERGKIGRRTFRDIINGKRQRSVRAIFSEDSKGFTQRYLDELSQEQRERGISHLIQNEYVTLKADEERTLYVARSAIHGVSQDELQTAYDTRQLSELEPTIGSFGPEPNNYVVDKGTLLTRKGPREVYFTHTLRHGENSVALQPVLHWRTTEMPDGTSCRELITDDQSEANIPRLPGEPRVVASRLAGLLALAYISPDIREKWPPEMGLKGSQKKQGLGAAQVTVLALMQRNSLLKSPVVAKMEELSRQ